MFYRSLMFPAGALLPLLGAVCWGEIRVTSIIYDTAHLPCSFHFIQGVENLLVIWEKAGKDGKNVQVYKSLNGQNDFSNQDSQFRGRTVFSGDISRGKLDLTLTGVTWRDDAVYYCRAANNINHGDNVVVLSVTALPPQMIQRAVEDDVTLVPTFFGVPTEINWKLNNNKLVDMELEPPEPYFYFLEDRAELQRNGSLTIRNLTKEDSGAYKSEALVNNFIQETEIRLAVLDRVSKPTIVDKSTNQEIILRCVSSTINVSYKWLVKNGNETTEQDYISPRPNEDVTLSCTVSNTVSEDRQSITIPNPSESQKRRIYFTPVILVIPLLVIVIVMHLFKRSRKFKYKGATAEKTLNNTSDFTKCINGPEMAENGNTFDENKAKTPIKGFQGTEEDKKDAADPKYNGNAQSNGLTRFHKASSCSDYISGQSKEELEPVHVLQERCFPNELNNFFLIMPREWQREERSPGRRSSAPHSPLVQSQSNLCSLKRAKSLALTAASE